MHDGEMVQGCLTRILHGTLSSPAGGLSSSAGIHSAKESSRNDSRCRPRHLNMAETVDVFRENVNQSKKAGPDHAPHDMPQVLIFQVQPPKDLPDESILKGQYEQILPMHTLHGCTQVMHDKGLRYKGPHYTDS